MENREKLLNLMNENLKLKVIPMVHYEVVEDDCRRWMGSIGDCYIKEYTLATFLGDDKIFFKEEEKKIEEYLAYNYDDEEIKKIMQEIKWKEVIFVNIDLPKE